MIPWQIEPARLERALALVDRVQAVGRLTYLVPASDGTLRLVVLDEASEKAPCGCNDQFFARQRCCKHTLAALLYHLLKENAAAGEQLALPIQVEAEGGAESLVELQQDRTVSEKFSLFK